MNYAVFLFENENGEIFAEDPLFETDDWDKAKDEAKRLVKETGYVHYIDMETGQYYVTPSDIELTDDAPVVDDGCEWAETELPHCAWCQCRTDPERMVGEFCSTACKEEAEDYDIDKHERIMSRF